MKTLYFDCFAGAAGDMILGALLDAGLPFDELQRALGSLAVDGYHVTADRVVKGGITAVKFRVHELAAVGAGAPAGRRSRGAVAPALPPEAHPRRHRPLGPERCGQGARERDVHAPGRG